MRYSWELRIYQSWDEVDDPGFLNQWGRWIEQAPDGHVFFHPAILTAWTDTYRKLQNISPLYCVASCGDITVFLPLVLWSRNWKNGFLRVIIPAGNSDYDYHDPIITAPVTDEIMHSFWAMLDEQLFGNPKIKYDEVNLAGIRFPGNSDGWGNDEQSCPYTDLTDYEAYDRYFASMKRSLRHEMERKKRRLLEFGTLSCRHFKPFETSEALCSLPGFLDAHAKRWPNAYKASGLYEAVFSNGISEGLVRFSELRINDEVIDWNIGFQFKNRFYYYMTASPYLEQYAKYSPGIMHLSFLIENCFSEGVQIFDFLRGAYRFKGEWTDKDVQLHCYTKQKKGIENRLRNSVFGALEKLKT